jgi:LytR cell envelope-related transcriptional attenuator
MTVFDRLEAQLLDAHAHRRARALPRPTARQLVAFAAAVTAVVVVAIAGLSGGSRSVPQQPGDSVAPVVPARTTVAVLNAAGRPGAARTAAYQLERHGWRIGTVTNYPDGRLASSCVDFTPGHSRAASIIAQQLGIGPVIPPAANVVAAAGHDADVIVVVGADRAR